MNQRSKQIAIGLGALTVGAVAGAAVSGNAPPAKADRVAIERIVRNYILENPEVLPQAMERLQGRDTARVIAANRPLIERPYAGAWAGAARPAVTLVQFFDYACGYCRAAQADVERLLRENRDLRVVYREFPVLGPGSEAAARVSLAAARIGRYRDVHRALYAAGRPTPESLARVARSFGIDANAPLTPQESAELARTRQLQQLLGLTGTPSWVIGDRLITGAVGYDGLRDAVARARAGGRVST